MDQIRLTIFRVDSVQKKLGYLGRYITTGLGYGKTAEHEEALEGAERVG
jgi:hypothetical protein